MFADMNYRNSEIIRLKKMTLQLVQRKKLPLKPTWKTNDANIITSRPEELSRSVILEPPEWLVNRICTSYPSCVFEVNLRTAADKHSVFVWTIVFFLLNPYLKNSVNLTIVKGVCCVPRIELNYCVLMRKKFYKRLHSIIMRCMPR